MPRILRAQLFATVLLVFTAAAAAQNPQKADAFLPLKIGDQTIAAMVARTPAERMIGLMYRARLEPNQGMLFVFPEADLHAMWMKNTAVPLSVAFIDEHGVIINIEEMKPRTLNPHAALRPAKYALEMESGWFSSRSIGPGARITGLGQAPAPE